MTATILHFPVRKVDADRLALVGTILSDAVPMPDRDTELDILLTIGGKLLDNRSDYQAPDCQGLVAELDAWVARLDQWDSKSNG